MIKNKTIVFLADGMADEPIPELNGQTPLQYANTPAMDSIANDGCSGTLLTLPEGFPTSSEVANMSVLGCSLKHEYSGRGPLEAVGRNIHLEPEDIAFRLNITTVEDGILKDYAGGQVSQANANEIINLLNHHFGNERIKFYTGVNYRNILVLSGDNFSSKVKTEKPDDNHGEIISEHLPSPMDHSAEGTAIFLQKLMMESTKLLETSHVNKRLKSEGKQIANGLWPWSGGKAGSLKTLKEKYGISSAVISAVDVINGLGHCLGMDVIPVQGATGYIDTNYKGKADAAIEALKTYDFIYLHVEGIDEVSHEKNLRKKINAIEDFDNRLVAHVLANIDNKVNTAILPDHPVPVLKGKHTRTPVPVAMHIPGIKQDSITVFNESACLKGSLGFMKNGDFINILVNSQPCESGAKQLLFQ